MAAALRSRARGIWRGKQAAFPNVLGTAAVQGFATSFEAATKSFGQKIATHSDNDVKLEFYALYKQATAGDAVGGAFATAVHHPK